MALTLNTRMDGRGIVLIDAKDVYEMMIGKLAGYLRGLHQPVVVWAKPDQIERLLSDGLPSNVELREAQIHGVWKQIENEVQRAYSHDDEATFEVYSYDHKIVQRFQMHKADNPNHFTSVDTLGARIPKPTDGTISLLAKQAPAHNWNATDPVTRDAQLEAMVRALHLYGSRDPYGVAGLHTTNLKTSMTQVDARVPRGKSPGFMTWLLREAVDRGLVKTSETSHPSNPVVALNHSSADVQRILSACASERGGILSTMPTVETKISPAGPASLAAPDADQARDSSGNKDGASKRERKPKFSAELRRRIMGECPAFTPEVWWVCDEIEALNASLDISKMSDAAIVRQAVQKRYRGFEAEPLIAKCESIFAWASLVSAEGGRYAPGFASVIMQKLIPVLLGEDGLDWKKHRFDAAAALFHVPGSKWDPAIRNGMVNKLNSIRDWLQLRGVVSTEDGIVKRREPGADPRSAEGLIDPVPDDDDRDGTICKIG